MYSIGEVSRLTGITASTLRYYETIGLIPIPPQRQYGRKNGIRRYDDADLRFIHFIHGLKQTGMKLQDIVTFTKHGCLRSQDNASIDINGILSKRIEILDRHIEELEQQMQRLETINNIAKEKRMIYSDMLQEQASRSGTSVIKIAVGQAPD